MAETRDVRFQSVILAGVVIKPHGRGESPVISPGATGVLTPGVTTSVMQFNPNVPGVAVFSMYREEEAFDQMMLIYQSQRNDRPRPPANGVAKDTSNPDRVRQLVWEDAICTGVPDFSFGWSSDIVTWTWSLHGVTFK